MSDRPLPEMPLDIRKDVPLMSYWTHRKKAGKYLITGYAFGMVPDSEYDHEWGVIYESDGVPFFRPISSFRMSFSRIP